MFSRIACVLLVCLSLVSADVIDLTEATFDKTVDGSTNVLVEFFAPWCGHCKNLAPEWKLAGETFQAGDDIILAAVDATENGALAQKFGVSGYPTIKFFPKGSTKAEDYNGGRTADTIISWVNEKVGTSRKLKVLPSSVTTLTAANFDAEVLGSKAALVEFYAPWCGHCKSLAPIYEKLGKVFAGEKGVLIAKVDATEEGDLATRYDVTGFPTLKYFPAGSSEAQSYEGGRDLESLVDYINEHAGTSIGADGNLKPTAGLVASIGDLVAAASHKIDATLVASIKEHLATLSGPALESGKVYLAAAEKIASKGIEYAAKEVSRLSGIINGGNVNPEKKIAFQLKQNILRSFIPSSDE